MSAVRKKKPTLEQQINEDGIRFLGKHISREKALALMVVTTLACAMPIVVWTARMIPFRAGRWYLPSRA